MATTDKQGNADQPTDATAARLREAVIAACGMRWYDFPPPVGNLSVTISPEEMRRQEAVWQAEKDAALDTLIRYHAAKGAAQVYEAVRWQWGEHLPDRAFDAWLKRVSAAAQERLAAYVEFEP